MMKSLIITLLCSFCLSTTNAQSYFRQCGIQLLTKQNGLSNNTLTGIYQDKAGFLWLGTDVGLSRYDGIHFHNYNLIDKEPRALTHLYETSNNLLWSHIANLTYIIHSGFISGYQNRYGDNLKPPTNVYHRMTA